MEEVLKKIDLTQVCVCLHFRSLDRFVTRQRFSADHLVKLSCFCKTLHPVTDWHHLPKYGTSSTLRRSCVLGF